MSDDLRESLTAAWDSAPATPDAAPVSTEATTDVIESAPEQSESRLRDELGRFTKAKQEAQAKADAKTEAPEELAPDPEPWRAPPKSWRKEMHERYGKLDPETMQYLHEREMQVTKGITDYKTQAETAAQRVAEFERVTQPYQDYLQQYGGTERLGRLLHIDKVLTTGSPLEKQNMMNALAQAIGYQPIGEGADPSQQMNPLMQEVHQLRAQQQRMQQELQAREQARALHEIEQFQQNAPYFDDVVTDVQRLLETGMATDLQSAYDRAIRLNDDVWNRVQQDRAKSEQAKKAAQIARASAVSPRSATPTAVAPADAGNLRSLLTSSMDALGGRV